MGVFGFIYCYKDLHFAIFLKAEILVQAKQIVMKCFELFWIEIKIQIIPDERLYQHLGALPEKDPLKKPRKFTTPFQASQQPIWGI